MRHCSTVVNTAGFQKSQSNSLPTNLCTHSTVQFSCQPCRITANEAGDVGSHVHQSQSTMLASTSATGRRYTTPPKLENKNLAMRNFPYPNAINQNPLLVVDVQQHASCVDGFVAPELARRIDECCAEAGPIVEIMIVSTRRLLLLQLLLMRLLLVAVMIAVRIGMRM